MADKGGTLETIVTALARIFEPLFVGMQEGEVRRLLAELGYPLTEPQAAAIRPTTQDVANKLDDLFAITNELTVASENDDTEGIVQKGTEAVAKLAHVVSSLIDLKNAVDGLGLTGTTAAEIDELPQRLFNYLLVTNMEGIRGLNETFELMGVLQRTEHNIDSTDPDNPEYTVSVFDFKRLIAWFRDPGQQLRTLFQWGNPAFDGSLLFPKLSSLIASTGLPVIYKRDPPNIDAILFELTAPPTLNPRGVLLGLHLRFNPGEVEHQDDDWIATINLDISLTPRTGIAFQPNGNIEIVPPSHEDKISGRLALDFTTRDESYVLLGKAGGSRLELKRVGLESDTRLSWIPDEGKASGSFHFEGRLEEGKVIIDTSQGDDFLTEVIPAGRIEGKFDLTIGFSLDTGFYIQGSSTLQIRLPLHIALGPIAFEAFVISVSIGEDDLDITLGADISAELGPLLVVVGNMGFRTILSFPDGGGNLGPLQLDMGFKAPDGLGLAIDSGGFTGGGFLQCFEEDGRYEGTLELEFEDKISLKAVGLLTTHLPGGKSGYSLLIIITAEFTPIQLGLGFTLNGVGGLLGLNRTADTERLRSGLRDNTLSSVLFPQNVIENASRILSDLNQLFPAKADRFLFGPMARIGWGTPTLITIDLGLLIEVPEPVRILILGVIHALLPDEDAKLLQLQVNFLGVIDFQAQRLSFDASLFDSKLLGLTLSGDMAVRLTWGENTNLLVSVGGFHPAYQPPPLNLPTLRRLTLQLMSGDNPRLTLETYYAITSNTVQFGAKLELLASAGSFSVHGLLSYDVLFQFNPFHFIASISAKLALLAGGSEIASISLDFTLEGPTPWHAKGTASLTICWFLTIKVRFDKTFGDVLNTVLPNIAVLPLLVDALSQPGNWEIQPMEGHFPLTSFKQIEKPKDGVLAAPFGVLTVQQKVVPLGVEIQRFGSQRPADANLFEIKHIYVGDEAGVEELSRNNVEEQFAPAQFFEMTEAQKLASKSFERYQSGVKLVDAELFAGEYAVRRIVEYELSYIDEQRNLVPQGKPLQPDPEIFHSLALGGAVASSALSQARNGKPATAPQAVHVKQEGFAVVNASDLRLVAAEAQTGSQAGAQRYLDTMLRDNPTLENELLVVPMFEVNQL